MTLIMNEGQAMEIRRHGEKDYPHETCGLIAGSKQGDRTIVTRLVPLTNTRTDSAHNRYNIDPDQYRQMEKELDAAGLEIVGIFHSHPDHPAEPSEYDRERALPWWSYVIVSVREGRAAEIKSWRLADDRRVFNEEPIMHQERKAVWQSPS